MSESKAVLDQAVAYLSARGAPATTDNLNRAMLAMRGTDTGGDPYQMDLTGEGTSTSSGPSTRTVSPASADSQPPVRNVPPALRGPIPVASPPRTAPQTAQAAPQDDLPMPPGPLPPPPTADAPVAPATPGIVDRIMEAVTGPATPTVPPAPPDVEGGRPRPKPEGLKDVEDDTGSADPLVGDPAVPAIGAYRNQGRSKPRQAFVDDQQRAANGPNPFTEAREQAWQYGEAPDPLGNGEVDPRASGAVNPTVSPLDLVGAGPAAGRLLASGARAVGREIYQRNPANQYGPPASAAPPTRVDRQAELLNQVTPPVRPTAPNATPGQSPRDRLEALLTERRAASNPPVQVNIPIGGRPPGPVQPVANNPGQPVAPALAREGSENSSGTLEALIRELNTRAPAPSTPYAPPPRPVGTTPSSRGAPRVVDEGNPTAVGQLPGRPGQVPTPSRPNTDAPAGVGTPANPASASTPPKGPPRAVTTPRSEQPRPRMPPPAGGSPMTPTSGPPGGMPSGSGNPYRLESNSGNPTATPATSVAPGGPAVRPGTPQQAGPPAPAGTGGPQYGPPSPQGMTAGQYAQQAARAESAPRMMPQSRPSPGGQLEAVLGEGYGFTAPITNTPQQMAQSEAARRIMELLVRRGVPREQAEQQAIAEVFKRGRQ